MLIYWRSANHVRIRYDGQYRSDEGKKMRYYEINQKGIDFIRDTLIKYHKNQVRGTVLAEYILDAANSANNGDSVAVHEIGRLQAYDGQCRAFNLDLDVFFDCKEVED